jgi:hypothetical protein
MRILLPAVLLSLAVTASASQFVVTRSDDGSGSGTLRWAIESANSQPLTLPERNSIVFRDVTTVAPAAALPSITQPVILDGNNVTIDGSAAGTVHGLVVATDRVLIARLTVTHFAGDGFAILGDHNVVQQVKSDSNRYGIRISGRDDDVHGSTFSNNREAGAWLTADAWANYFGKVTQQCVILCPYDPGENYLDGNVGPGLRVDGSGNFLDGLYAGTLAANGGDGILITGTGNHLTNSVASNNLANGLTLAVPLAELTNTFGTCNGKLFLDNNDDGPTPNDFPDLDNVLNAPRITSAVDDLSALTVIGSLDGQRATRYRIYVASFSASCEVHGVGFVDVTTDANGFGSFRGVLAKQPFSAQAVTRVGALATLLTPGASPSRYETSELSAIVNTVVNSDHRADLTVSITAPAAAPAGTAIPFEIRVSNRGPAALYAVRVDVPHSAGAIYSNGTTTVGECYLAGSGFCNVDPFGAGDTAIIRGSVAVGTPGNFDIHVDVQTWSDSPEVDPAPADNTAVAHVLVGPATRMRAARH